MKTMHHSVSGLLSSVGSGLLNYLFFCKKTVIVLVATIYAYSSNVPTPQVNFDYKPVTISESIITIFTIVGSVLGYIIIYFLKGVLADPEAPLTIKCQKIIEFLKFKKKKKKPEPENEA